MNNQQSILTYQQAILSIVIMSAITGCLVAFEEPRLSGPRAFYLSFQPTLLDNQTAEKTNQPIALIAQANRINLSSVEHFSAQETTLPVAAGAFIKGEQLSDLIAPQKLTQLLFAFDSFHINASDFSALNKAAELIKNGDSGQVWQIIGYADSRGDFLYNQRLAEKRAQEVAHYLVNQGVSTEQIAIVSLGASRAEYPENHSFEYERRVDIQPYQEEVTTLAAQIRHIRQIPPIKQASTLRNAVTVSNVNMPFAYPLTTEMVF